ncbi:MAG: heavy metal translocating P-type ATPase, partial [Pseudonocardiaceae bacterium]
LDAVETLASVRVFCFDKTGTLTEGRARLADVEVGRGFAADEVLGLAASIDQVSTHALAAPIVRAAAERSLALTFPSDVVEEPGRGIRGLVGTRRVAVGRAGYVAGVTPIPVWAQSVRRRTAHEGMANVFIGVDDALVGVLILDDPLRPDAGPALQRLRDAGIRRLVMVTGDHVDVADAVASVVGVDAVFADQSPTAKVNVVRSERARGVTVMVGDGINDAAALAQAELGLAMGTGTDAAIEASDLTLVRGDLRVVADAIRLSRRTLRTVKGNLFWAFGYNVAALPLAAAGLLNPMIAGAAMAFSSVFVVSNSLRLRSFRPLTPSA